MTMRSPFVRPIPRWLSSAGEFCRKSVPTLPRLMTRPRKTFRQFAVRDKIVLGYVLAVSIPVIGTSVGLVVGNRYQKAAMQALTITYEEQIRLHDLESRILHTRIAKELGPYAGDSERLREAANAMRLRLDQIRELSIGLESAQTRSIVEFAPALSAYQRTIDRFSRDLDLLIKDGTSGQRATGRTEQRILLLAKSRNFREFIEFSEQVDVVIASIHQDIDTAQQDLNKAEILRSQIVLGSLLASVLAAIGLAVATSQMICRPLESLTDVARSVIRDEDVALRAPVITQDEIGTLAIALNQLIEWVQTYTNELKAAQLQLIQAEKMSSVGQLVAGVAHEINNPVNFIHGNINPVSRYAEDLLETVHAYREHYPNPPESLQETLEEKDLEFIETDLSNLLQSMTIGTTRIRDIVLSLRNFSRLDESDYKTVDLHEGIDNTLLILQHRLKGNEATKSSIEVIKSYAELPAVECLPGAINQVIMNVIVNALDALDSVECGARSVRKTLRVVTQKADDDRVQILIADNGQGMAEDVRSRIFDPFFTTKPVGQGTGLGLSISYQIVTEQHGGHLTCESALGEGTQFVMELPIVHTQ